MENQVKINKTKATKFSKKYIPNQSRVRLWYATDGSNDLCFTVGMQGTSNWNKIEDYSKAKEKAFEYLSLEKKGTNELRNS